MLESETMPVARRRFVIDARSRKAWMLGSVSFALFMVLPGMLIGGVGMSVAMDPMTITALSTVAVDTASVASGVLSTSRQVGGALGIAVMGAIVAAAETVSQTDSRLPLQIVHGFQHAPRAGGAIALVGCVLSAVLVRSEREATALTR